MIDKLRTSLRYNLLLVILVCAALYFIFFSSLGWITNHGSEIKVPNVTGKMLKAAEQELERMGFDVDIDSSYDPTQKPFLVLAQIPDTGSIVKTGRTVFLTVNKATPPMTAMPKLTDLSYRSALMIIKSSRLVLGDTTHRPDYANGAVLDQLFNGKHISPGDMLPQGSTVNLVIGSGFGTSQMNVPNVIGMTVEEGMAILNSNGLTVTTIWDGPISDSGSARIYRTNPPPYNELGPNQILEGDVIDIRIEQDPSREELKEGEGNKGGSYDVDPNEIEIGD